MLREAKDLRCPVLLHVHTVKGQGYGPAEADPGRFHGIGPFDVRTGSGKPAAPSFSSVFGETLTRLAGEDRRICALTAAMVDGTGLTKFSKTYPSRFFDVGIAEGHAVATAAGMAKQGLVPVLAVYSSFLQRGYDMLLHDVALSGLHVVLGVDRAGLVGADGETHHGCFDVMYLSQVPGMKVFCPASFAELRTMLRRAVQEETGPVAVRYPRGGEGAYQEDRSDEAIACLASGDGYHPSDLRHPHQRSPVRRRSAGTAGYLRSGAEAQHHRPLVPGDRPHGFDRHEAPAGAGGLRGDRLRGPAGGGRHGPAGMAPRRLVLKNTGDRFIPQGSVAELRHLCGLDAEASPLRQRRLCMSNKTRLDVLLTERGLAESRQKAQAVIMAGHVFVAGPSGWISPARRC